MKRRALVKLSVLASLSAAGCASQSRQNQMNTESKIIHYPSALKRGDIVCCVAPATVIVDPELIESTRQYLQSYGLSVIMGKHVLDRSGYLAGTDENRAHDINAAFANPKVKAILALRGGWGSNRLLPHLDFAMIAKNPKIFMGFSDITTLLNAFYHKAGLVTFHGPVGFTPWSDYSLDYIKRLMFEGQKVVFKNEDHYGPLQVTGDNVIRTINPGVAEGRLVGGNMSVWLSLSGSDYLPDMRGKILFFEDVNEALYRIDRYLSTLKLNGTLDKIAGIIFGSFREPKNDFDNEREEPDKAAFTLVDVITQYIRPLNIPCYMGAQIGHIRHNPTWPVGGLVSMDASTGTLRLLEPAVVV